MKKVKINNGITLIALVITIIILLILAGVTIGIATNGTGLFEKAKEATEKYQNAQEDEEMQVAKISNEIDNYISGNRATLSKVNFKTDGSDVETNEMLDGKTIYARYIDVTMPSTSGATDINHNIPNVDKIWIDIGNSFSTQSGDLYSQIPFMGNGATFQVSRSYIKIYKVDNGWPGATVTLLLKYTKITD